MFIELHVPDRVSFNTDYILTLSESSEGNAVIEFSDGDKVRHFICEETYDEVFAAMSGEEEEDF